jgi:hypothetical protein
MMKTKHAADNICVNGGKSHENHKRMLKYSKNRVRFGHLVELII